MTCYAFFDTDILYHYPPLEQIDWRDLLSADQVVLVYAPIISRQLNRHKDNAGDPRLRRKAGNAIRRLEEWLDANPLGELCPGVSLTDYPREPIIDFAAVHLNPNIEDDWLTATAIEFKRGLPEGFSGRVVVVTGDRGLARKASVQREIDGIRLDSSLRLPEVEDDRDREMRELRQTVQRYENAAPKLRLGFSVGAPHMRIILLPPRQLDEDKIETLRAEIWEKHKKMSLPSHDPMLGQISMYSSSDIRRFNAEIDKFRDDYEMFFRRVERYTSWSSRAIEMRLMLSNTGTAVAEDVTLRLRFPGGRKLRLTDEKPREPEPPKPPQQPQSSLDFAHYRIPEPNIASFFRERPNTHAARGNILDPEITEGERWEIRFDIARIKHNVPEALPSFYVVFDDYDDADSFAVECEINAANMPDARNQDLHVQVQNELAAGEAQRPE